MSGSGGGGGGDALRERLRADASAYCACYCEENVARRLAALPAAAAERRRFFALVISNARRSVAVAHQRAAGAESGGVVVWDYHVVLLENRADDNMWLVFDLDSTLPFPSVASEYLSAAFPLAAREELRPAFRLAGAELFLARFSSTRRHMRGADGAWLAPPPSWPCFHGVDAEEGDNLALWLPPAGASSSAGSVDAGFGEDAIGVGALLALLERARLQRASTGAGAK